MLRHLFVLLGLAFAPMLVHAQSLFDIDFGTGRSHPFDVQHIALDVRFNLDSDEVIGDVRHTLRSLQAGTHSICLDADSTMTVERALVDGRPAAYTLTGSTLCVDLNRTLGYDSVATLEIAYRVRPKRGLYFIHPDSTTPEFRPMIWTQGEAQDNHHWFPLYDYPNDLATTEVTMRVPTAWQALSNGTLVSTRANSDGTTTWHYQMNEPHAGYLVMVAAGDFLVTRDTTRGVPMAYYTDPGAPGRVAPTFGRTGDMLAFYEDYLGVPFPWNKYDQIVVDDFMYGGMENTTAVVLVHSLLVDSTERIDRPADGTIAHELAHQWFGDLVTARSWAHLWLHESFATWMQAFYFGHAYGPDEYAWIMYQNGLEGLESDETRGADPIVAGQGWVPNLYPRGSRVIHMLRATVGPEAFRRGLHEYLTRNAHRCAETHDLQVAMEDASGLDLDWFFREWLYRGGHPDYAVSTEYSDATLHMTVLQTQKHDSTGGRFVMPIPIELHFVDDHGNDRFVADTVVVANDTERFVFPTEREPDYVIFDAGDAVLKRVAFPRTTTQLLAQLRAPRMIDRYLAAEALAPSDDQSLTHLSWEGVTSSLQRAYQQEGSDHVRAAIVRAAARVVGESTAGNDAVGQALRLVVGAMDDRAIDVRKAAIEEAECVHDRVERAALLRRRLTDSSVSNRMAALEQLASMHADSLAGPLRDVRRAWGNRTDLIMRWVGAVAMAREKQFADDVARYAGPGYRGFARMASITALSRLDTMTPAMLEAYSAALRSPRKSLYATAAASISAHPLESVRGMLEGIRGDLSGEPRRSVDRLLGKSHATAESQDDVHEDDDAQ